VIIHSLFRNRERIKASEFKNVVGRAGRAFVDVEGQVLYPVFDNHAYRIQQWEALISDMTSREMESGLVRLVFTLLIRMHESLGKPSLLQLVEYVLNNAEAWTFPELQGEDAERREHAKNEWEGHVAMLDTAILSLLGEHDIADDAITASLDDVLQSSLWHRRLMRRSEDVQEMLKAGLFSRTKHIWGNSSAIQRRGYFLAGVGLDTGHALDVMSEEGNALLVTANAAILTGEQGMAIGAITAIAERVFTIPPFVPDPMPANWRDILSSWLLGLPLVDVSVGQESETMQFVESGLVYRLPWAMEAIRVRGIANGDVVGDIGGTLEDFELSSAVTAVETGTLNRSAAILIQAGFSSRLGAIKAVTDTQATFSNGFELRQWLTSDMVSAFASQPDWPTAETHEIWASFSLNFAPQAANAWKEQRFWAPVTWKEGMNPPAHLPVRIISGERKSKVFSADALPLGSISAPLNPNRCGLLRGSVAEDGAQILLTYFGPEDLWLV
jgi:hypothetical protein